jgi:isoamylase
VALGACWSEDATTFKVFSSAGLYGGSVDLVLLGEPGHVRRVPMNPEGEIWEVTVEGVAPGQRYGFRASGPFDPARGLRFDARRTLVDPYAHAIETTAPRDAYSLVVDPAFDWNDDRPPGTPLADTVLYETHIKGMTKMHPAVPTAECGTYLGLTNPAVIRHLTTLGVSAVELLPVHQFLTEQALL